MDRARIWLGGALAIAVVAGIGGTAYAVWGGGASGGRYDHALVRYGSGTVVIVEGFTPDTSDEDDSANVRVGVVCRDLGCEAKRIHGVAGEPQVTPDGRSVLLDDDESAMMWTASRGIRSLPWSGRPGNRANRDVRPTTPALLAPDGSLRVVGGTKRTGACTYRLYTSEPSGADASRASIRRVAQRTVRDPGSGPVPCSSYLDTFSPDWLATHPDDHRPSTFCFVRRAGAWTSTLDDPSGLIAPDRDGRLRHPLSWASGQCELGLPQV